MKMERYVELEHCATQFQNDKTSLDETCNYYSYKLMTVRCN
jgi:hypothetical protein